VLVEVPVAAKEIPGNDQTNRTDRTDEVATAGLTSRVQAAISPAVPLAKDAEALLAAGRNDKAREQFLSALAANPEDSLRVRIENQLGTLNVDLVRHPWPMPEKQDVVVQEGDSVKAIARKFGTTVDLIVKGNELKRPDVIRPGQHLKVFSGKMEIRINKARNDLLLTAGGRFFKRYRVGTGRYDKTPVGSFVVTERISEPPWWRDDGRTVPFGDKENILGTRWMAIKATGKTPEIKGYGIHGTWDTNSIGKAESAGCIRLKNEDVEELFELIPIGTPVVIEE
jgi:lipoprotein-anchoring transpeptidase ErfK/SrfK